MFRMVANGTVIRLFRMPEQASQAKSGVTSQGGTGMQYRTLGRTAGVDLAAHEKHDTPPALLNAAQRRR
jgi:hypothetical protein